MMKSKKQRFSMVALVLMLATFITLATGCGDSSKTNNVLTMADPGWDSVRFHNEVAGYILENGYDIKTEQTNGSSQICWQGLIEDDIQILMEAWTEQLPPYADDIKAGNALELSTNFNDNRQGLYVPAYMINGDSERGIEPLTPDLKTVEDLKKYPEIFKDDETPEKGRIYGAISGWVADEILYNKYEAYGLDEMYTYFRPGSDAAMVAALVSAYEAGEPWVGYYWEPTWVSGKYDLVLLEDAPYENDDKFMSGLTAYPSNNVMIAVNPSVKENHPEVVEFLSRYQTSTELTAKALAYMNDNDCTEREAAIWFLKEHDDLLETWVTDSERLARIREALNKE